MNRNRSSRSRSRTRKSPPLSPVSKRGQSDLRRRSPQSPNQRSSRRSPDSKRSTNDVRRRPLAAVSILLFQDKRFNNSICIRCSQTCLLSFYTYSVHQM